ncbi:MAG: CHAT domain-containing protein, partial [bacterium]|nr:CHAT domain-containing protein [bacterium]
ELLSDWRKKGARGQAALEVIGGAWERLPLEAVTTPGSRQPLALAPWIDLFRASDRAREVDCPDIDGPLKILMAVAAPWTEEAGAVLDYERELGKVMDIVESLPDFAREDRRPIVHILDQGALDAIRDAFQINRYHVLHISAHGKPGALHLETEDGGVDETSAEDFATRFPAGRQPVLTVLSACHSGAMGELTGFAQHLVHHGFAYVAAMQTAVSDQYATRFAETIYHRLAHDERPVIETAFTNALVQLEEERGQQNRILPPESQTPPEWMAPALYKSGVNRHVVYEPRPERYNREMETPAEDFDPGVAHRKVGEFVGR